MLEIKNIPANVSCTLQYVFSPLHTPECSNLLQCDLLLY